MSEGLKALENIKREAGIPYFSTLYDIDMWREDFATIEKELKENERLKASYLENLLNEESKETLYDKLKALEILKRIDVNIQELLGWLLDNDYDGYFDSVIDKVEDIRYVLTKQEFIFLKGVLC